MNLNEYGIFEYSKNGHSLDTLRCSQWSRKRRRKGHFKLQFFIGQQIWEMDFIATDDVSGGITVDRFFFSVTICAVSCLSYPTPIFIPKRASQWRRGARALASFICWIGPSKLARIFWCPLRSFVRTSRLPTPVPSWRLWRQVRYSEDILTLYAKLYLLFSVVPILILPLRIKFPP